MASAKRKTHDNLAPKLLSESLTKLGEALVIIGKPLYPIFSHLVLTIFVLFYITGYIFREVKNYFKDFPSYIRFIFKTAQLIISGFFRYAPKLTYVITKAFFQIVIKAIHISILILVEIVKNIANYFQKKLKLKIPKLPFPKTKLAVTASSTLVLIGIGTTFSFWHFVLRDLPGPNELTTREVNVSTKIYDRNGDLMYTIYEDQNRTPVSLDQIPSHVQLATIAIEDAEFYNHPGFSVRGMFRAIIRNIKRGELTGGSTITQQLVKNALLSPEKTFIRKSREIVLAIKVELTFSKDEILEMYLNEVAYGGTSYGIQEAAREYFNKDVDELTLSEAALLAGLPKSPTRYSPFGENPETSINRQKEVINLMKINGFITPQQAQDAQGQDIEFAPNITDIEAPHFVMFVRRQLVEKYGEEVVAKGGLEVITTLDLSVQKLAEEIVANEVDKLKSLNVGNGAALVIDTQTGEILAMVGSKNYFDLENDGNVNLTTALRQPGSSIKIVNYSYALENALTPATILADTPITYQIEGQPPYSPKNYDNKFRGNIPLRNALAESRNVPAVKVLATYGVEKMIEQGKKMGITTWENPSNYGLSLTLGGGEVKLIELAQAYATIANYGRRPDIAFVLKVTNYQGKVLEERNCKENDKPIQIADRWEVSEAIASEAAKIIEAKEKTTCKGEQVIDPRVAYMLIDILKDNRARSPAFGNSSLLAIPNHSEVAVKTGTSNNLRDNLAIGFNQKYLVATWVGNNDNSPMSRIASGVTGATPIFHNIISALLAQEKNHDWIIPEGLVQVPICPIVGTLPCKNCPIRIEWFLEENQPQKACSSEFIKKLQEEEVIINKDKKIKPPRYPYLPADRQGELLDSASQTER